MNDASFNQTVDADAHGGGERVGITEGAVLLGELLEPLQRPTRVGVVVALLLSKNLVENLIDKGEGSANGQPLTTAFKNLRVPRIDRHAGANGRLGKVDWGDVARLKVP